MWAPKRCPDCGGAGVHKYGPSVEPQAELCGRCYGLGTILESSDKQQLGGRATDEVEAIFCSTWNLIGGPVTSSREDVVAWAVKFAQAVAARGLVALRVTWLIEKDYEVGPSPEYWGGHVNSPWTTDPRHAVRFSRREDAERVINGRGMVGLGRLSEARPTDHLFMDR